MSDALFDRAEYADAEPQAARPKVGQPRLRRPVRDQIEMQMAALDQLLEPEHAARGIWSFVERLDLTPLLKQVQAVEGEPGRDATDPRLLLAVWVYATTQGISSARKLEGLCRQHMAYRWLCGGVSLCHKLLSDFRSGHAEALDRLLTQVVGSLMHQGLVTLQTVAQDGMKVRAAAGKASFRHQATLQECLQEAQAQVQALKELEDQPQELTARQQAARERAAREHQQRVEEAVRQCEELAAKREQRRKGDGESARASTTDPDARVMKFSDGGYRPGYNVQFATDVESGVIVGCATTNAGNDFEQLEPMAEQLRTRYGRSPGAVLADGGFCSLDAIEALERDHHAAVYCPVKEADKKRAKGSDPYAPCAGDSPEIARWRERMGSEAGKANYLLRCQSAEWSNAQCRNRGFWFFVVRGIERVRSMTLLHALTHNIQRALRLQAHLGVT